MATLASERFKLIAAVYLLLRDGENILLAQRAGTGFMDGYFGTPAGHLDGGETALQALVRESREEAGIVIEPADAKLVYTLHRLCRDTPGNERIELFFEVRQWSGTPQITEPDKCSKMGWFTINDLPNKTIPHLRQAIGDISAGVHYREYEHDPLP